MADPRIGVRLVPFAIVLAVLARSADAQTTSSTTGAINGRVADKTSAVMPGVTVTIASASMMGTRTAVTSEDGTFRFAAVPPGEYSVTFERAGWSTVVCEGIRVAL